MGVCGLLMPLPINKRGRGRGATVVLVDFTLDLPLASLIYMGTVFFLFFCTGQSE